MRRRDDVGALVKPFPGAPLDAEYSPEGWLLLNDEAWRRDDWMRLTELQRRAETGDVPLVGETLADAQRRRKRERDRASRARRAA